MGPVLGSPALIHVLLHVVVCCLFGYLAIFVILRFADCCNGVLHVASTRATVHVDLPLRTRAYVKDELAITFYVLLKSSKPIEKDF